MTPKEFQGLPVELVASFETANVELLVKGKTEKMIDLIVLTWVQTGTALQKESPRFRLTTAGARQLIQSLEDHVAIAEGLRPPSVGDGTHH